MRLIYKYCTLIKMKKKISETSAHLHHNNDSVVIRANYTAVKTGTSDVVTSQSVEKT